MTISAMRRDRLVLVSPCTRTGRHTATCDGTGSLVELARTATPPECHYRPRRETLKMINHSSSMRNLHDCIHCLCFIGWEDAF
jgi:hypothetical protein